MSSSVRVLLLFGENDAVALSNGWIQLDNWLSLLIEVRKVEQAEVMLAGIRVEFYKESAGVYGDTMQGFNVPMRRDHQPTRKSEMEEPALVVSRISGILASPQCRLQGRAPPPLHHISHSRGH